MRNFPAVSCGVLRPAAQTKHPPRLVGRGWDARMRGRESRALVRRNELYNLVGDQIVTRRDIMRTPNSRGVHQRLQVHKRYILRRSAGVASDRTVIGQQSGSSAGTRIDV